MAAIFPLDEDHRFLDRGAGLGVDRARGFEGDRLGSRGGGGGGGEREYECEQKGGGGSHRRAELLVGARATRLGNLLRNGLRPNFAIEAGSVQRESPGRSLKSASRPGARDRW